MSNYNLERRLDLIVQLLESLPERIIKEWEVSQQSKTNFISENLDPENKEVADLYKVLHNWAMREK